MHYDLEKNGKAELYDLGKDLAETKDLAKEEPERVAAMLKIMEERRQPSPIFPNKALDR